ncbi:hypothetical protein [Bradyrhizobium japonicum]|uniref:hypothetical protein n=1 Tax=Bradyrhizobium japonicum TaxID=375 RepID=UPI001E642E4F|nr:hypothetical protein [Bradyrhizobium japonicum]MCD9892075.1 hypothetical protein [Bradyrhizobium japonicum]WRJ83895.1 hypothetical protein R3F78_02930 [Bradyrhizobium japonicum]WRJ92864.1 hypothetical protein R3F77_00645 [Bradyrhizobium japonicum]WRK46715.1 hypothetical protein R3F73_00700 [Bradyrhizobium japonicum]
MVSNERSEDVPKPILIEEVLRRISRELNISPADPSVKRLREALTPLFECAFKDGEVLEANRLNALSARLHYVETVLNEDAKGSGAKTRPPVKRSRAV